MSFGVLMYLPSEHIEECKSTDQNVADVPIDDLISREEALDVVCKELQYQEENRIPYDSYDSGTCYGLKIARELLLALPSAEQTNALKETETKEHDDLISRADALEQMAQAECGLHYEDCEADKCYCSYIQRILDLPPADRTTDNSCRDYQIYSAEKTIANDCDLISREAVINITAETGALETQARVMRLPSADRPQVNSNSAEEQIAETCDRPKGECDDNPQPYVPEASTERVVHCKDCIYSRQPEEELFVCENRFGMSGWVRENEFCSSGSL